MINEPVAVVPTRKLTQRLRNGFKRITEPLSA